jgi:hypothetical protein
MTAFSLGIERGEFLLPKSDAISSGVMDPRKWLARLHSLTRLLKDSVVP